MEKLTWQQRRNIERRETRARANAGDPEAQALVKQWYEATIASKAKAREEGRSHDAAAHKKRRAKAQQDKAKGAAGDVVAQAAYEAYRKTVNAQKIRQSRRKGVVPMEVSRLRHAVYMAAVKTPVHISNEKHAQYQKASRDRLKAAAAAGDEEAIALLAANVAKQSIAHAKWREKRREKKARINQAAGLG